ncbi:MAG: sensor domain-containing diguanylate cyclase [Syntrophales bacterium]|jgi:diguanylate cyclase (GGDEF)-like protein/PAS domain S-box-containing protein|nr:sensor domain-containing diguanylate cyclase [Syntrophales bacterium]
MSDVNIENQIRLANADLNRQIALLEKRLLEKERIVEALQDSEKRYRRLFESAKDGILILDADTGKVVDVNPFLLQLLGYSYEELFGQHIWEIGVFKDIAASKDAFRVLQDNEYIRYDDLPLETIAGQPIAVEFVSNVYLVDNSKVIQCNIRDISERKHMEKELLESESRFRTLVESTHDFVFMVDREGLFTYVNPNLEKATCYSLSDLKGRPLTLVIARDERESIMEKFKKGIKGAPSLPYETELLDKEGKVVAVEFLTSNLCDSRGIVTGRFGVGRDITKRKEMESLLKDSEKKYRELSIIDALSQLYNSRYFYHQLKKEIDRVNRYGEQPITLILLDIDNFKAFNDTYGHVEGDEVISRLGQVVKRCLRQTDSAYRYGGEEFTILLPMTKIKNAVVTAERIRSEFKKEIFSPLSVQSVHVTMSLGIAQYQACEDMKTFVNRADQLMYQAKKNGKDTVYSGFPLVIDKPVALPKRNVS